MRDDFAILIMSYGRTSEVPTLEALKKSNYTGKWFIVIGDDDPNLEGYKARFGDKCIIFKKADYIAKSDRMGLKITKVIMFARNACFDIAKSLGLKFFMQLDDDYRCFKWSFDGQMKYITKQHRLKNYGQFLEHLVEFYERTPAECLGIAHAQGGDFIGGEGEAWAFNKTRKCMNSWICSVDRHFQFAGCMNEDVNAYTSMQACGYFFLNIMQVRLDQPVTQTTGGMTAVYKQYGTHVKSFLSVMRNPSFVKVSIIQHVQQRLHHSIDWNRCAAKIIRETHKKKTA